MFSSPLSNRPVITSKDILSGYVTRYFARNTSTKLITEIDKIQYEMFRNNALYETLDIPWIITGLANDTVSSDNKIIYGTKHKNTVTINFYENKMPGLNRVLRNPLEYFQGLDNRTK